ncbi:hypothetical protein M0805_002297 [Coniferiporia weirii]|nr:hypothetical protein M0805_002297 [Coniferiporia weirii]
MTPSSLNALSELSDVLELFMVSNSSSDGNPAVALDNAAVAPSSASNPQSGSGSAPLPSVPNSSAASPSPSSSATESASAIVSAPESVSSAVSSVPKDDPSPAPTGSTSVISSSTSSASPSVSISQRAPGPTSKTVSSSAAPAGPNNVAAKSSSSPSTSSHSASKSETFVTDAPTPSATISSSSSPSSAAPTPSHSAASSSASGSPKSTSTSTTVVNTQHAQTSISTTSSTIRASQSPTAPASSPAGAESNQPSSARPQPTQPTTSGSAATKPGISINPGNSFVGSVHTSSTTRANTELSTPVFVTTTESSGKTVITTPALITSLSVTTGTDGVPQTHTSVFANPTSVNGSGTLNEKTFWDNKGAVAGVFVVVTLVILASVLGAFMCCRRRRQRSAHGIAVSEDMFRGDIFEQPVTYQTVGRRGVGFDFVRDDPQRYLMAPSFTSGGSVGHEETLIQRTNSRPSSDNHASALGLSGMPTNSRKAEHTCEDPFSDYHRHIPTADNTRQIVPTEPPQDNTFPISHSSDSKLENVRTSAPADRPPSPAPSSPSIYPPSLPAVPEKDEDDYLFYERETQRRPLSQLTVSPPETPMDDADPRDPFYSKQDAMAEHITRHPRIQTGQAYRPLTPPDSSVGHSALPSPTTSQLSHVEAEAVRPLNPFSNAFLGRPVSAKIEPLPRPMRSPLRVSSPSLKG